MKANLVKTSRYSFLLILITFISSAFINPDSRKITGTVSDISGEPLIGVSIVVDDTKKGTVTDIDGAFEIILPSTTEYIKLQFTGYKEKLIPLTEENHYKITLEEGLYLDEVVVTSARKRRKGKRIRGSSTKEAIPAPTIMKSDGYSYSDSEVLEVDFSPSSEEYKPAKSEEMISSMVATKPPAVVVEGKKKSPKAGQLTAGEWNDLNNWEAWKKLIEESDYKEMGRHWQIQARDRISVFVTNQYELPIPDCDVILRSSGEVIWSAKTDNAGKAELWINDSKEDLELFVDSKKNSIRSKNVKRILEGVNVIRFEEECAAPLKAEIMFVVDATGSMGDEIEFLKSELSDVIDQVESSRNSIDFRWGSVFYRDETDSYLTRQTPLSDNKDRITSFIGMQSAGGGGDYPEAVNEGLEEALMQDWSSDAIARIVFLVLDAPPHHNKEVISELQSQIEYAASIGVKIIPITASGINRQTEYLMKFMSIMTNGTYVFLTDHSGIGNAHLDPVVKDYEVEKLNNLLVRLINNYTDPGTCIFQEEEDPIFESIEVYPNPAVDFVQVKVPEGVNSISLTTATGQLIHKENISKQCDVSLDLTTYIDGMYLVNFYTDDSVYTYKVIKSGKA